MGISNLPKQFLELGDRPILIHTIEKFVLEPTIEKIVVGVHGDWVTHAEDLVEKFLPLHKDRIIITKGGADRNSSIEKIIEAIDAYRPLTADDIVVTHDSVRPFITLRMIQDNIALAQNHDAVDTVVEAVDTIVESTNGQFITDIPNRAHLYQGQTPQTFRCKDFIDLYGSLSASNIKKRRLIKRIISLFDQTLWRFVMRINVTIKENVIPKYYLKSFQWL